ncbi:MAG: DUF1003 domain-containing protein [Armatimonadetes bacterium]|nr:DUF1003 domain-containing protein [Armatimonadota bacterium]
MQIRRTPASTRNSGRWDELFAQSDPRLLEAMEEFERAKTFGDKLADFVTAAVGSWWFVTSFMVLMIGWFTCNLLKFCWHFDPPPFVLLNLVLSTIAAFQASVILKSQARQGDRDRLRAQHEYLMNLATNRELQELREEIGELKDEIRALARTRSSRARDEAS